MSLLAQSESPGIADNKVLDQWTIPFGDWIDQMVRWVDQNLEWLLDAIRWPFAVLFRNFVAGPGHYPWWQLTDMRWIVVCALFFVVGTLVRNIKVGSTVAGALALCGLLGSEYWEATVVTLGIIIVSVLLCAIIGLPVGILCGRRDGVWNVVRPILDAMQVVHPFVYMLPVIFFFSIGFEPATMVTMVFALPPLIRLTNLGIRQVPEDVVEASRAYGAPELRVLLDVQLPLARPAIMTGLNQTLLLSFSMLGIAAIMGAGGLGGIVYNAIREIKPADGMSAGLALFVVAVILDRISQPEHSDPENLFRRIHKAWVHRRDPELLLPDVAVVGAVARTQGEPISLSSDEKRALTVVAVGALIAIVAVFLPWGHDSGKISGYARLVDTGRWESVEVASGEFEFQEVGANPPPEHAATVERLKDQQIAVLAAGGSEGLSEQVAAAAAAELDDQIARLSNPLAGSDFNGLSASGGSFYGIVALGFALVIVVAVVGNLRRPGRGPRLFGSNGLLAMAFGLLAAVVAYLWAPPAGANASYSEGIGPWIAAVGAAIAVVGAVIWLRRAPYTALRPLRAGVSHGQIGVAAAVVTLAIICGFSAWLYDVRVGTGIVPDPVAEARIAALEQQAREDPSRSTEISISISRIANEAKQAGTDVVDGFVDDGSKYGYLAIGLAAVSFLFALPAAGAFGGDECRRRRWSAAVACIGVSLMVVATAWIASLLRVADPQVTSGAGAFICMVAGFLLIASTAGVLTNFGRSQVYVSIDEPEAVPKGATADIE